jgi:prefoldin subunit 5
MESKEVTIELNVDMENVNASMSEMVKVLRGLVTSLDVLNESVARIDSTLAEIRNLQNLMRDKQHRRD